MAEQRFKRAEYKTQRLGTEPYLAPRAEWYRCSEGLTIGQRMTAEGEIMHISELDIDVPNPDNPGELMKAESFQPLSLPEQERRFGRIMYMPYNPSDEELAELGWQRTGVIADEGAASEQMYELHAEDYEREIDAMGEADLRKEGQFRFGLTFPAGTPPSRMRKNLTALYKSSEEEGFNPEFPEEVTEQMKANVSQRVGTEEAHEGEVTSAVRDAVEEDERAMSEPEQKAVRRARKAAAKMKEAETGTEENTNA